MGPYRLDGLMGPFRLDGLMGPFRLDGLMGPFRLDGSCGVKPAGHDHFCTVCQHCNLIRCGCQGKLSHM